MNNYKNFAAFASAIILLTLVLVVINVNKSKEPQSKVESVSLELQAVVKPEIIQFIVYPEKRIPLTGNWDTIALFNVLNCSTGALVKSYPGIATDPNGIGVVNIPLTDFLLDGNYAFSVKGFSHLTKEFGCYSVNTAGSTVNLTGEGVLLAGDTSVLADDYINSLDISNLIRFLYSTDYKNDLNQDTRVNSLDLSVLLFNYYKSGD